MPVPMSAGVRDALVAGFKALADPSRFEIFRLIAAQPEPLCACDVVARFDLSQPTISHHLKVLREAGVLNAERVGKEIYFSVNKSFLQEAFGRVSTYLDLYL